MFNFSLFRLTNQSEMSQLVPASAVDIQEKSERKVISDIEIIELREKEIFCSKKC